MSKFFKPQTPTSPLVSIDQREKNYFRDTFMYELKRDSAYLLMSGACILACPPVACLILLAFSLELLINGRPTVDNEAHLQP